MSIKRRGSKLWIYKSPNCQLHSKTSEQRERQRSERILRAPNFLWISLSVGLWSYVYSFCYNSEFRWTLLSKIWPIFEGSALCLFSKNKKTNFYKMINLIRQPPNYRLHHPPDPTRYMPGQQGRKERWNFTFKTLSIKGSGDQ